jgi:hypothetical protein
VGKLVRRPDLRLFAARSYLRTPQALAKTKSVDHDREFNQGLDAIVSGLITD